MMKTAMLDPLITRVSMIREVVIRITGSRMSFQMVRVNKSFSRGIMVGRFKVGEVLLLLSNGSNMVYLVIVLQSVLL